jgi:hypothetical protein
VSIQRWTYDGVVLGADDKGEVSRDDLKEFLAHAERLGDGTPIRMYEYGLRATRVAGEGGPRLDWRD